MKKTPINLQKYVTATHATAADAAYLVNPAGNGSNYAIAHKGLTRIAYHDNIRIIKLPLQ
jgi:hypothetical protein